LNPHGQRPPDFKSGVYTNFTTPAVAADVKAAAQFARTIGLFPHGRARGKSCGKFPQMWENRQQWLRSNACVARKLATYCSYAGDLKSLGLARAGSIPAVRTSQVESSDLGDRSRDKPHRR
jgi:hypothetical protein